MRTLHKFVAKILRPAVRAVPVSTDAQAADWAARHYSDEMKRALAARFALLLENQINKPLHEFTPTSRFYEDLKMHDLEPIEVLMAIEQEFQVEIPGREATPRRTFDDIVQYLTSASTR